MTGQSGGSRHLRPRLSHALIHMLRELGEILDEQVNELRESLIRHFLSADEAARAGPFVEDGNVAAEEFCEQAVEGGFQLLEVPGPFGRFFDADVFFAVPADGVEEQR